MALVAVNSTRFAGLNRTFSGVASVAGGHSKQSIAVPHTRLNWCAGSHAISEVTDTAGMPYGVRHPYCFVMPRKAGAIKSFRRATVDMDGSAGGELGLSRSADGSLSLDGSMPIVGVLTGTADGLLTIDGGSSVEADGFAVASGAAILQGSSSSEGAVIGTATGAMTLDASVIAGLIVSAAASGSFALNGSAPVEGALEATASGSMTLSAVAELVGALSSAASATASLGASSSIEARGLITAQAVATLAGSIEIMGDGFFTASTENTGDDVLTADAVANAVMAYTIESGYSFQQVTRLMSSILAGKTSVVDNGDGTATVTFRNLVDDAAAAVFEMDGSDRSGRVDDV